MRRCWDALESTPLVVGDVRTFLCRESLLAQWLIKGMVARGIILVYSSTTKLVFFPFPYFSTGEEEDSLLLIIEAQLMSDVGTEGNVKSFPYSTFVGLLGGRRHGVEGGTG